MYLLYRLISLLSVVRSKIGHMIGLQLDPFEFPEVFRFTRSLLARIAFIEYYEAYLDVCPFVITRSVCSRGM
jgi:hypothetical protein